MVIGVSAENSIEETGFLRNRIADLVYLIHLLIVLWIAFGWLGPVWALWVMVALYLGIEIHWKIQDSWCILRDLERYLRKHPRPEMLGQQSFITRILVGWFGINFNPAWGPGITKGWGRLAFIISVVRLYMHYF
ncbi:MAG: DUF2784 family protein [Euryarchaeota archaeon]|jgi:hypothetical protein|nr:DUF2784 family protein [Euryarchaeota archaeon]MBT4406272.1 DUF2784 family protein [Euryarchaeota archaeon]MBT6645001.1 DUF2784 family protein [Euryarchaeota archaeon]